MARDDHGPGDLAKPARTNPPPPHEDESWEEPWDEGALVLACMAKERAALITLVLGYAEAIHAGAVRAHNRAGRPSFTEPQELAHKFFVRIFADPVSLLHRFDRQRKLAPFLVKVAYNQSLQLLLGADLRPLSAEFAIDPVDLETIPNHPPVTPIDPGVILDRVLAQLSDTSRDILEMRLGRGAYAVQRTVREIAEKHRLTCSQVYHRLAKMRRLYRMIMASLQGTSSGIRG